MSFSTTTASATHASASPLGEPTVSISTESGAEETFYEDEDLQAGYDALLHLAQQSRVQDMQGSIRSALTSLAVGDQLQSVAEHRRSLLLSEDFDDVVSIMSANLGHKTEARRVLLAMFNARSGEFIAHGPLGVIRMLYSAIYDHDEGVHFGTSPFALHVRCTGTPSDTLLVVPTVELPQVVSKALVGTGSSVIVLGSKKASIAGVLKIDPGDSLTVGKTKDSHMVIAGTPLTERNKKFATDMKYIGDKDSEPTPVGQCTSYMFGLQNMGAIWQHATHSYKSRPIKIEHPFDISGTESNRKLFLAGWTGLGNANGFLETVKLLNIVLPGDSLLNTKNKVDKDSIKNAGLSASDGDKVRAIEITFAQGWAGRGESHWLVAGRQSHTKPNKGQFSVVVLVDVKRLITRAYVGDVCAFVLGCMVRKIAGEHNFMDLSSDDYMYPVGGFKASQPCGRESISYPSLACHMLAVYLGDGSVSSFSIAKKDKTSKTELAFCFDKPGMFFVTGSKTTVAVPKSLDALYLPLNIKAVDGLGLQCGVYVCTTGKNSTGKHKVLVKKKSKTTSTDTEGRLHCALSDATLKIDGKIDLISGVYHAEAGCKDTNHGWCVGELFVHISRGGAYTVTTLKSRGIADESVSRLGCMAAMFDDVVGEMSMSIFGSGIKKIERNITSVAHTLRVINEAMDSMTSKLELSHDIPSAVLLNGCLPSLSMLGEDMTTGKSGLFVDAIGACLCEFGRRSTVNMERLMPFFGMYPTKCGNTVCVLKISQVVCACWVAYSLIKDRLASEAFITEMHFAKFLGLVAVCFGADPDGLCCFTAGQVVEATRYAVCMLDYVPMCLPSQFGITGINVARCRSILESTCNAFTQDRVRFLNCRIPDAFRLMMTPAALDELDNPALKKECLDMMDAVLGIKALTTAGLPGIAAQLDVLRCVPWVDADEIVDLLLDSYTCRQPSGLKSGDAKLKLTVSDGLQDRILELYALSTSHLKNGFNQSGAWMESPPFERFGVPPEDRNKTVKGRTLRSHGKRARDASNEDEAMTGEARAAKKNKMDDAADDADEADAALVEASVVMDEAADDADEAADDADEAGAAMDDDDDDADETADDVDEAGAAMDEAGAAMDEDTDNTDEAGAAPAEAGAGATPSGDPTTPPASDSTDGA